MTRLLILTALVASLVVPATALAAPVDYRGAVVGDPQAKVRFALRGGDRITPFTTNNLTVQVGCGQCGQEARWVRVAMLDSIAVLPNGRFRGREGSLQSIARVRGRVLGDSARGRYRYVKNSELFGRIDSGWVRWRAEAQ